MLLVYKFSGVVLVVIKGEIDEYASYGALGGGRTHTLVSYGGVF